MKVRMCGMWAAYVLMSRGVRVLRGMEEELCGMGGVLCGMEEELCGMWH